MTTVNWSNTGVVGRMATRPVRGVGSRKIVERPLQKVGARSARDFANLINIHCDVIIFVILLIIIACRTSSNALFFTLHTPHATKGRCLMIFIVFGSPHLSRRGYNNNEYYYDRRKSAAAMAYLAAAAPTPLQWAFPELTKQL